MAEQHSTMEVMTRAEVANLARISQRTLDRLSEDGRGPARMKLSDRRIGFNKAVVLAWLASRQT